MKKILKRVALALALLLVLGTGSLAVAVIVREDRTFDAPYPELHASTDPAVLARGRYLALGPAHCVSCHADPSQPPAEEPALAGGLEFHLEVGTVRTPNLTPDPETGIGRYSDPELARVLRHGVHPSGRAMLPFMPFADLSDDDLTAVISYLRSRPPVRHAVAPSTFNVKGRLAKAFVLEPTGPRATPPRSVASGPTVEYGKYLTETVANCAGCHTRRGPTGEVIGVAFAGGMELESHTHPAQRFVTPNLTPHADEGHLRAWDEEAFVRRFRYAQDTASPMPWGAFRRMTDDDLRAIYRYLRTLPPARTGQDLDDA